MKPNQKLIYFKSVLFSSFYLYMNESFEDIGFLSLDIKSQIAKFSSSHTKLLKLYKQIIRYSREVGRTLKAKPSQLNEVLTFALLARASGHFEGIFILCDWGDWGHDWGDWGDWGGVIGDWGDWGVIGVSDWGDWGQSLTIDKIASFFAGAWAALREI
ncbi:MAG: hypothetical protein ACOY3I_04930 [Verrucomicrobiota bacterium]